MLGRRFVIPVIVAGSVAIGGVAGAVIGVPALSGASTTSSSTEKAANGNSGSGNATTAPNGRKPRAGALGGDFAAAAKALNLTTEQLMQRLSDGKTTIADIAKQENIDINDVIKAIAAADVQRIHDFVNNPLPKFGAGKGGPGPAGFGRFGGMGGGLDAAAKALGITNEQLQTDLRSGKSIADIAKEKNVPVSDVIKALTDQADARIDQAFKDGKLTQAQADNAKKKIDDVITNLVNGTRPAFGGPGGPGMGGGFGMRGHGHFPGAGNGSSSATTVPPVSG